jgi:hypothetical protein
MSASDLLATVGVALLLIAFVLNQRGVLDEHTVVFLLLNCFGAALCAWAAWLVRFMPFVVLESVWSLVAGVGLWRRHLYPVLFASARSSG